MTRSPSTVDLADALPRRAVAVRPPQTVGPLAMLGLFTMLFAFLGGLLWWLGPDLVRDWRIGSDTVSANDVRIEDARCRSRLFVLYICDLTLAGPAGAKRRLWYIFLDAPNRAQGTDRVVPLRGRSDPELVATDLGLAKLLTRSLTLVLAVSVLALCIGVGVRVTQQGLRNAGAFRSLSGERLTPVVVEIERHNLVPPRRRLWVYLYDDAGRQKRGFIELPSRDRPLFTDASEKWALALRGKAGATPLLLDAQLSCLDLTAGEKEAFYAACRRVFSVEDGDNSA
jgi:hypothetical protein